MSWGNDKNEIVSLWWRRGLLAYVYNGVSLTTSTEVYILVAGNGSYIVRPCGHDLRGPIILMLMFMHMFMVASKQYNNTYNNGTVTNLIVHMQMSFQPLVYKTWFMFA